MALETKFLTVSKPDQERTNQMAEITLGLYLKIAA